jgi:hypothetical protein
MHESKYSKIPFEWSANSLDVSIVAREDISWSAVEVARDHDANPSGVRSAGGWLPNEQIAKFEVGILRRTSFSRVRTQIFNPVTSLPVSSHYDQ